MNNEKKFIKLTPFKMQVLQSFPFIDEDFDAITNYELLCKVVEYLNTTVDNVDLLNEKVTEFENYFDNLDLQEEVNNKLDEMAESGELTDIIAQYLRLAGVLAFNTVNDMKNATNLVNGSIAKTLGFYNVNDNGASYYKIRTITNDDVIDEVTLISLYDNNLIAELIKESVMNVKQFGVKLDNSTDNTTNMQIALNYTKNLILKIDNGILLLNNKIELDNNHIIGSNTTIKASSTFSNIYYMVKFYNSNNIENIKFDGSYVVRQITTSENTIDKLDINNCEFTGCMKYVNNDTDNYSLNYAFVVDAKELIIKNSEFHDNYGHGLRLYQTQSKATVLVDNCKFYNNGVINNVKETTALGIVELGRASGNFDNVTISNCVAYNNANTGFGLHSTANCTIINCNAYQNKEHGYCLMDGENGKILNCNSSSNTSYGFRIQGDYNQEDAGYKNFIIKNCISQNEANIYVSNKIDTGIIEDNILYCKPNYGFCMTIGDNNSSEIISNLIITNNKIISTYSSNYPIAFYIPNNGTNYVFNNYLNGEIFDGNNYKTDVRFLDKNNNLKYGISNNIVVSPDNFSQTWYVIGTVGEDHHTLTANTSSGYIAQQLITLDKINPKYVSVIVSFNNPNNIPLEPQILLRDDQGGTTNLGYFERIVENMDSNQTVIGRIIDISKLDIPSGTNIGKVGIRLRTLAGVSNSIYINYVYVALSNELPVIPVN